MKKIVFYKLLLTLSLLSSSYTYGDQAAKQELTTVYQHYINTPSDINEHIPVLKKLASECASVGEIGIRSMVSTWGILEGLAESKASTRFYVGMDLNKPPIEKLLLAKRLAEANGIAFEFIQGNDMQVDMPPVDFFFIDSLHTYCHLTYELEKFSPNVQKYITLHDTSAPWGDRDDTDYRGNYSEYPTTYDKTKRGLWPAVQDFLAKHPEWVLMERRFNNHGLTTLKRVAPNQNKLLTCCFNLHS